MKNCQFLFQSKVKVRRASISEPSDTDYESRPLSSTQGLLSKHVCHLKFQHKGKNYDLPCTVVMEYALVKYC